MKQRKWIECGLLILLPLLVYLQSLGNIFVAFDDELLILDNPTVHGLSVENIKRAFTTYDPELYVPLTLLSYQVEYSLFGLDPFTFHTTSLVLHIFSGLLVFGIFHFFFKRNVALVLALLFALHPMNVEAVSWASGRKDLLASMFFLLSLWLYLRWSDRGKGYVWSIASFALGLLAKVSIVPLPFILILIDWLQGRTIDRADLRKKIPYFLLAVIFIVIALFGKSQAKDVWTWVLLSFVSIPFYVSKYLLPINLSIFYPFTGKVSLGNPTILLGCAATIAMAIATIVSVRWTKRFAFAVLWFLLLLAPSFPTVIKGGEDGAIQLYLASDRYIYLAGLGILFLLGTFLTGNRWKFAIPIIAILAILTVRQSLVWRESASLFSNVIAQNRPAYAAYLILADVSAERGDFERAEELYRQSLQLHRSSKGLLRLGQVLMKQGRNAEAIEVYEDVLGSWPNIAEVHESLGELSVQQGNLENASRHFQRAIEITPNLVPAHFNLGVIYEHRGEAAKAIESFEAVLKLDPTDEQARRKLQEYGQL